MPRDLGDVLAALARAEGGRLEPEAFSQLLGALGVTTAAALNPAAPSPPGTAPSGTGQPGLDSVLEHMDAEQLKSVAKRFDPAANAVRKVECRKAVLGALGDPAKLDALIRGLTPLEHTLLGELKRRGGVADGWSLVVTAALRAHAPAPLPSGSVYSSRLASAPGVGFLGRALRDGLLIPVGPGAPWFTRFGFADDADDSLVFADPRLLARLDTPLPPPEPLELAPASASVSAPHPVGLLLELFDTLLLVGDEGGLQLTQNGAVAKPLLNRLKKRRPEGADGLGRALYLGLSAGLFSPPTPAARAPWPVDAARLRDLQAAPFPVSYALVLEAALGLGDLLLAGTTELEPRPFGLTPKHAAQRALLESLAVLPPHPVALAEALDALWERALKYLYAPPYYRPNDAPQARPAWLTEALLGFHALGLVGVAEGAPPEPVAEETSGPGPHAVKDGRSRYAPPEGRDRAGRYVLAPALGLEWYAQAGTLQAEAPAAAQSGSPLPNAETAAQPVPQPVPQPALLIQPNFDVLVYLGDLTPGAVAALSAAELRRLDAQTATYTLTRARFYRALELGFGADELLGLLEAHSRGVPDNVAQSLRDWAARRERLRVRPAVTLLEYPDRETRDAALALLAGQAPGAEAVAERFVRTLSVPSLNYRAQHRYDRAPARTLRFSADGSFQPTAPLDLPTQAVLARFARQDERGAYHLDTPAVRSGGLTTAAYDTLAARALGGLPPQLETLLAIWRGKTPPPTVARVGIFSHPNAPALARHPEIAPLLGEALNGSSYLVEAGQEDRLAERLKELGVTVGDALAGGGAGAADALETGLPTRRLRERLEAAITAGKRLELRYHREVESDYGGGSSRGSVRTEKLVPEAVYYSGATPYLEARTLGGGSRYVRIGYIVGYREL